MSALCLSCAASGREPGCQTCERINRPSGHRARFQAAIDRIERAEKAAYQDELRRYRGEK